jgi:putative ABC transport system permease protein
MNSGGDPAVYVTLADAMTLQTSSTRPLQRVQAARGAVSVKSADRSPP